MQDINFLNVKAVGIDLDGVVYLGKKAVPGAARTIKEIRDKGLVVFFITNNSAKTRAEILAKLSSLGIQSSIDEIFTSGYAAAILLKNLDNKSKISIIGSDGLKEEFSQLGLNLVEGPPCDFLVVGYDPEFTYQKISTGLDALLSGAKFMACNRVANFPGEKGHLLPGCGPMVAAIASASGKEPDFVVGKPNTFMLKLITQDNRFKPEELLVIGDTPESDIVMANRFGSPSVLIAQANISTKLTSDMKPKLIVDSLVDMLKILQA